MTDRERCSKGNDLSTSGYDREGPACVSNLEVGFARLEFYRSRVRIESHYDLGICVEFDACPVLESEGPLLTNPSAENLPAAIRDAPDEQNHCCCRGSSNQSRSDCNAGRTPGNADGW